MTYKNKEKQKEFREWYQSTDKYKKYKQKYYLKNREKYLQRSKEQWFRRTHCDRCRKKTTETWDGWCQQCIDDVAII